MSGLLEEFIQFLVIWLISTFITGILLNSYVVKYFGGQWLVSGLVLAIAFYMLFKGLIGFGSKHPPSIA